MTMAYQMCVLRSMLCAYQHRNTEKNIGGVHPLLPLKRHGSHKTDIEVSSVTSHNNIKQRMESSTHQGGVTSTMSKITSLTQYVNVRERQNNNLIQCVLTYYLETNLHSTGFAFVGDENVGFLVAENVEEEVSTASVPSTPPYEDNTVKNLIGGSCL